MPQKAFGQNRRMGTRERSELFTLRQKRSPGFVWTDVNQVDLLTALDLAMQNGATLSFAPGNGGRGITMRLWQGKVADSEYAGSPEELDELLGLLIDGFASTSEDPREVTRLGLNNVTRLAAD